jgi:pullulanase
MFKKSVSIFLLITMVLSLISPSFIASAEEDELIIHYIREDKNYEGWNIWLWPKDGDGLAFEFEKVDDNGAYFSIPIDESIEEYGFIVRMNEWEKKDFDKDQFINVKENKEIYIFSGKEGYSTKNESQSEQSSIANTLDEITLRIHYHRFDEDYNGWNIWLWPKDGEGTPYSFNNEDEYGVFFEQKLSGLSGINEIGLIVRLNEWEAKDIDEDRFVKIENLNDNILEIYLVQGDKKIYTDKSKVDMSPKFTSASFISENEVQFYSTTAFDLNLDMFYILDQDGNKVEIESISSKSGDKGVKNAVIKAKEIFSIWKTYKLFGKNYKEISIDKVSLYDTEAFKNQYTYSGDDLGANYSNEKTTFKIWAPTANKMELNLFKDGANSPSYSVIEMDKSDNGVFEATVEGDLNKVYYTYKITIGNDTDELVDPYAKAAGVNGQRGMIIDLDSTDPQGWDTDVKPEFANYTDAVVYELHIRDLATHEESGIKNVGKFISLTETGTTNKDGLTTGIDHLKELGITHLQILPMYDYNSVDESSSAPKFNWGYDPLNYNVPEGSYSTDPYNGEVRINEMKTMIKALHDNGIRVVMDVVYNHTALTKDSNLNKAVPEYYYRTSNGKFSNASGCGNETASEREMARKFIVDSVKYWVTEYHIDGFRFDLMGIHDIETMKEIESELHKIDPSIIIYGEGWTGGTSTLSETQRLVKKNISKVENIGAFNDDMRDGIKGHVFEDKSPGFVSGAVGLIDSVKFGIVGSVNHPQVTYQRVNYSKAPWANSPIQSINYVAAHDNLTLYDKLKTVNKDASEEELKKMSMMADAIVLTSQGVPFIHAGSELLRSKNMDENSYQSPDSVNMIDWSLKTKNQDVVNYYKGLIEIRKAHPAFRMTDSTMVANNLIFFSDKKDSTLKISAENMIAYLINNNANNDIAGSILVAFNGSKEEITLNIPDGEWDVLVKDDKASAEPIDRIKGNNIKISPLTSVILVSKEVVEPNNIVADEKTSNKLLPILGAGVLIAGIAYLAIRRRKK